jgi:carbon starvation protein
LISSGTTPKLIARETSARPVGYGAMALESYVGIMALIAACALQPGVFFAVNSPAGVVGGTPQAAVDTITAWGYPVTVAQMDSLAAQVGEETLMARTGGAPSLALGMAYIFSRVGGVERFIGFWYHFAIMFEALFILTILDAGTRVGRFMLQDLMGSIYKPLGRTSWMPGVIGASAAIVLAWGYFLIQGVRDPLGGINSLWPLFGIANQLLAAVALAVATTVLIKMHRWKYIWVTAVPMVWLVTVTYTASYYKIFSPDPYLGFLAQANQLQGALAAGTVPAVRIAATRAQIFNNQLDAVVCGIFVILVTLILADSLRIWTKILFGGAGARVGEAPFVLTQLRPEEI